MLEQIFNLDNDLKVLSASISFKLVNFEGKPDRLKERFIEKARERLTTSEGKKITNILELELHEKDKAPFEKYLKFISFKVGPNYYYTVECNHAELRALEMILGLGLGDDIETAVEEIEMKCSVSEGTYDSLNRDALDDIEEKYSGSDKLAMHINKQGKENGCCVLKVYLKVKS